MSRTPSLHAALACLATERPVFHSEADFQHALAWTLREQGWATGLRLERRFDAVDGRRMHVDLVAQTASGPIGVELKYWKQQFDVTVDGERFNLPSHGARDLARHDFWADVRRLETLVHPTPGATASPPLAGGYVIALTNDPGLWTARSGGAADEAFDLADGRVARDTLSWGSTASSGTTAGRAAPIELSGTYGCRWIAFSEPAAGAVFRVLVVEVGKEG